MKIQLGFGYRDEIFEVPDNQILDILTPNSVMCDCTDELEVRRALCEPIGSPRLKDIVQPGETVAIVTSDITRPMPTHTVMPLLLEELYEAGVKREDITLVFALGSHRAHTKQEKKKLAGEQAYEEIKCIDSNASNYIHMGTTVHGTPVDIVREVAEADRRICLGNIEYHYFAGYSGGAKAIMPGVSTREAIQVNHSMMVDERAYAGHMEDNPVRQDIEEAAAICGVDFIVNVVLDEHKKIICAVAGDVTAAHRAGCRYIDELYQKQIDEPADIVIVSQGGAPKDINLYQTQKALDNAKHAVKKGGIIILVGSCREGLGEEVFEEWMRSAKCPEDMICRIKQDFQLGGHKAAAIAMVLKDADIYLVSELEPEFVRQIFLQPFSSVSGALEAAFEKLGQDAKMIIMPYGGSTLPMVKKD